MARPVEEILRNYLGDQVLTMAKMTADLEAAREELEALKAKHPDEPRPLRPNGGVPPDAPARRN